MGGLTNALGEAYNGVAGYGDTLVGSTDKAVGRAADSAASGDVAGVTDNLSGSFDEAFGQGTEAALSGDPAGVGDALVGSTDEAVGRSVDEAQNGDLWQSLNHLIGSFDETVKQTAEAESEVGDAAAGSVDESVGRQFDDQPGGGFIDEALSAAQNAAANATDPMTPEWVDWVLNHPWAVAAAVGVGYLFVSAGGISDTAEASGGFGA